MLLTITISMCCLAALATFEMLSLAVANYNPGSVATIGVLGGWDVLVYIGVIALAIALRRSRPASIVMAIAAVVISVLSVTTLYIVQRPYFTPPTPATRVLNSAGPIVEFGLPIVQWSAFAVAARLAKIRVRADGPRERC